MTTESSRPLSTTDAGQASSGPVVTIGETMVLMSTPEFGPLQHNSSLALGIGGSESNVAIGLRRLGTPTTWIGKVGADSLGDLVEREIRAEGVSVVAVRDLTAPTALMIKERRTSSDTRVWYYRSNYAGSRLAIEDIDFDLVRTASLVHLTGISLALSPGLADVIIEAARVAGEAGVPVSFDLNFRSKLWSIDTAREAYRKMLPLVDIVFAGDDEAAIAAGTAGSPLELAHRMLKLGAGEAIIKLGARGAVAVADGREYSQAAVPIVPIDTVGAGDAFVAGYLSERLAGASVDTRLRTAVAVGAYVCLSPGDWEGLPRRDELETLGRLEPVRR
ncbi:sugar kinase [Mycetocola sp.]|uniref:sugar kinase n=1 Tax=Mycetocola sp. TaxID=1871042 RepID=UPI003989B61B